ncbi:MAG: protease modulator HflC [Spirochaetes bacterium]|nr:MAG: protease modulator HflC [Spirochaetota bacterium]RKX89804.1 MAG: protease modulator HflC [Spirochaetota bacterium]
MTKNVKSLVILIVIVVVVIALRPFFILPEGEQAVVTRFGRITKIHTEAGLKLKMPAVDKVIRYSKKILSWDGDPQRVPTSENQFIWVDTTARWQIVDLETFYQRVTVMDQAYSRLDNIIESAVRTVVSKYPLSESVRSSDKILTSVNAILDFQTDSGTPVPSEDTTAVVTESAESSGVNDLLDSAFAPIKYGRKMLSEEMLASSQRSMPEYGIELLDVVIRQIRYSDDLTQSVYDRMISERQKVATGYRSDGNGLKAEWLGRLNRDKSIKLSEADREAAITRADGDAQAARIYADAYNVDPEFYSFWKALESYRETLPDQRKVLSTDMDFFRYLYKAE